MSKKIAAGADAIVLDVKCGSGAFMKTPDEARVLAQTMVDIGRNLNRKVIALIGDMDQPLGHAIGNALEVKEAIETLHGRGPADFAEHCLVVAAHMLHLGEKVRSVEEGRALAEKLLADGSGYRKFLELVQAQGGDVRDGRSTRSPAARLDRAGRESRSGRVRSAHQRARSRLDLGRSGRGPREERRSHRLRRGHSAARQGGRSGGSRPDCCSPFTPTIQTKADAAEERLRRAIVIGDEAVKPLPLFYGIVEL